MYNNFRRYNKFCFTFFLPKGAAKQKKKGDFVGPQCYYADADVKVTDGQFAVSTSHLMIAGFSLLDQTYKEKTLSEAQKQKEQEEKQKLADNATQLNVSVTRKQMTIVGWSPNLLQNSSGQV